MEVAMLSPNRQFVGLISAIFGMFLFLPRQISAQDHAEIPAGDRSKPQINVLTDCGARGDGVTDDGTAIQRCIDTHPNQTIMFPKTNTGAKCDYELGETISFKSYSTVLQGVGGNVNNNTILCWTNDVTGISITGGQGQSVRNLSLHGSSGFNAVKLTTYAVGNGDGIRVNGGMVSVRDVFVAGFSRHGLNVDSALGGGPDEWSFDNVRSESNRGDGFHFSGRDANAGLCLLCVSRLNQGWGFYYDAVIPSTFVAPLTDGNHNDPTIPAVNVDMKDIVVENGIATLRTAEDHHMIAGDWGVIRGCATLSNKWSVIGVPNATTLQFRTSYPDGIYCRDGSATIGYQSGARVWAQGRTINDAQTQVGSYNVVSTAANWTQRDYGTLVCVTGAGPGGAEFCSTVKSIYGYTAVLADTASRAMNGATARIVTNGGPFDTNVVTLVESYTEGNQEGLSQLGNSLILGANWGTGANPEAENTIFNQGYATPIKFTRLNIRGGYSHSIFQVGRAFGRGSVARDSSYEGFWNVYESDKTGGTVLAMLSFRRTNVDGTAASGWNCFSQNPADDGSALKTTGLCLPDKGTRVVVNGMPVATSLPMFPAGGFWVKSSTLEDSTNATSGLRAIRYDQPVAPKSCNPGDIFYRSVPLAGTNIGWVCTTANSAMPFGGIASSVEGESGEKVRVPKSSSTTCSPGQWAADSEYYYVCTANNTWKRAALSSW
jgi:hypothetical protein